MSTTHVIIAVAVAAFCIMLLIAWFYRARNFFAVALGLGVAVAGVAVTVYRVEQYDQQKAVAQTEPASVQANQGYGSSAPPNVTPPAPPIIPPSPLMSGPSGAAAPESAKNPYLGAGK